MKYKKIILLLIISILLIPISINAKVYKNIKETISEEATYENSALFVGNDVNLKTKVEGITFAIGNKLEASGESEFAIILATEANINQNIEKDLYAAGQNISIKEANIKKDVYIAGTNITINNSTLNQDVRIIGTNVVLSGAKIAGDINIKADIITIEEDVTIAGKLIYNSSAKINNVEKYETEIIKESNTVKKDIVNKLMSTAGIVFLAIIINLIYPKFYKKILETSKEKIVKKGLIGLLILIGTPIVCGILSITLIGIPTALILLAFYILAIYMTTLVAGFVLGNLIYTKVFHKEYNFYISFIIGIICVYILQLIPYVGSLVGIVIELYGLGCIAQVLLKRQV